MPGERRKRERAQSEEAEQDGPGHTDLVRHGVGEEAGQDPDQPGRNASLPDIDVEISPSHLSQHSHQVGKQQAQADDQDGRALHVEMAEPIESCESETHAQQRNTERAGAEQLPEATPDLPAHRSRDRNGEERKPHEESQHQRSDRAKTAAGIGAHTGTVARVTRRSWKCGSTG
jgi:hypothetical protein